MEVEEYQKQRKEIFKNSRKNRNKNLFYRFLPFVGLGLSLIIGGDIISSSMNSSTRNKYRSLIEDYNNTAKALTILETTKDKISLLENLSYKQEKIKPLLEEFEKSKGNLETVVNFVREDFEKIRDSQGYINYQAGMRKAKNAKYYMAYSGLILGLLSGFYTILQHLKISGKMRGDLAELDRKFRECQEPLTKIGSVFGS